MIRFDRWLAPLMVHRDEIKPDPMNDNNGDVEALAESLQVNGCYRPVYANAETKFITGGHTLYEALLSLDATYIPVAWGDGDEETHRRRLVGDNQIARLARPDRALTVQLLDTFMESDLKLLGTGFTEEEYAKIMLSNSPDNFGSWGFGSPDPINMQEHTCPKCGHTWSD